MWTERMGLSYIYHSEERWPDSLDLRSKGTQQMYPTKTVSITAHPRYRKQAQMVSIFHQN